LRKKVPFICSIYVPTCLFYVRCKVKVEGGREGEGGGGAPLDNLLLTVKSIKHRISNKEPSNSSDGNHERVDSNF
jgi:hypothetical protein